MRLTRTTALSLILLLVLPLLAACGNGDGTGGKSDTPIRVASKDFTEQFILGEMYALLLEDAGFKVERKLNLGGTPVAQKALEAGEIDLYPEYTGTGLLTVLKLPTNSDRQEVYNTVSREYKSRYNLVWLEPAPMNNTQGLAMTREDSEKYGIKTISDLAAKAEQIRLVAAPEFAEREDALPGLKRVYGGFNLKEFIPVASGLRYKTLLADQAEVTTAYGTDGQIAAYDLVTLKDDKHLWPPYQVAPVVRQAVLDANPKIRETLNKLAPKLTDETMRRLNHEVDGNKKEPAAVAKEFLKQEGLLKK